MDGFSNIGGIPTGGQVSIGAGENSQDKARVGVWLITGGMIVVALSGSTVTSVGTQQPLSAIRNVTDWTSSGNFDAKPVAPSRVHWPPATKDEDVDAENDLASSVIRLHEESGLTWEQLSRLFGVSRRALHHWAVGGRISAGHAERLAMLTSVIQSLPATEPAVRRAKLLAPRDDGRSMFDILRSLVNRGDPITGSSFRVEALIDARHDRDD
ncbi:helix-turn-helix domain-containing protein [Actinomadura hibisca]|uniref:helix-turn-helix domain-containing protein n=1 Tax=Actinomadura hibisca TaxID=68565 RepID=UPI0012F93F67|nr:helix-turn-helix transcriptional regulator [Actinomadura hibisca]